MPNASQPFPPDLWMQLSNLTSLDLSGSCFLRGQAAAVTLGAAALTDDVFAAPAPVIGRLFDMKSSDMESLLLQLVPTPNHKAEDIADFRNRSGLLVKQWQQQQQQQLVCALPVSLVHIDLSNSSCDNNCMAVIRCRLKPQRKLSNLPFKLLTSNKWSAPVALISLPSTFLTRWLMQEVQWAFFLVFAANIELSSLNFSKVPVLRAGTVR
jgi:hypothetical protein